MLLCSRDVPNRKKKIGKELKDYAPYRMIEWTPVIDLSSIKSKLAS